MHKRANHFLFLFAGITLFLESADLALVPACLVPIAKTFGINESELSMPIISYVIGTCIFVPVVVLLGKLFFRPYILFTSLSIFILASFFCGVAPNIDVLTIARFFQGVAISIASPLGIIMLMENCRADEIVYTTGWVSMFGVSGALIGRLLGTLIAYYLSWRYAFYINIPVCSILLVFIYFYLIKDKIGFNPLKYKFNLRDFDLKGFILLSLSLILTAVSVEKMGESIHLNYIVLFIFGVGLGTFYYRDAIKSSKKTPVLNLSILNDPHFYYGMWINVISRLAMTGVPIVMAIVLQNYYQLSIKEAGYYLSIMAIFAIFSKFFSRRLSKLDTSYFLTITVALATLAIFIMQYIDGSYKYWLICAGFGFFTSLLYTAMNSVMLIKIEKKIMADACNVQAIIQQLFTGFGTILAIAIYNYLVANKARSPLSSFKIICAIFSIFMLVNFYLILKFKRAKYKLFSGY